MFAIIICSILLSATTVPVNVQASSLPDVNKIIEKLYELVVNGQYDVAVNVTKNIRDTEIPDRSISETVKKLLDSRSIANPNVISFAYKLWNGDAKNVVRMHFPVAFKNIFNQDSVKIVNKEYGQALKLEVKTDKAGDRRAFGDSNKTSERVSWNFIALWENNEVVFKIKNTFYSMYLKLGVKPNKSGDRIAYGSSNDNTDRHKFFLEPQNENGELVFFIINYEYCQGLKLVVKPDSIGDRALMSHNGTEICPNMGRHKWIISEFTTSK